MKENVLMQSKWGFHLPRKMFTRLNGGFINQNVDLRFSAASIKLNVNMQSKWGFYQRKFSPETKVRVLLRKMFT